MNLFNDLFHLILLTLISNVSCMGTPTSLCENPIVTSIDRLTNKTIRIYRYNHYWDIDDFSVTDYKHTVKGPFPLGHKNMGPVTYNQCIVTILSGVKFGHTFKFDENRKWYAWDSNGTQWGFGIFWDVLPVQNGISACFHNDDLLNPLLIGFANNKVYYYSTKYSVLVPDGNYLGYEKGRYNENFPSDISAAFSWMSKDSLYVFLFNEDKFCKRKFTIQTHCEWRPVKELFGCDKLTTCTTCTPSEKLITCTSSEKTNNVLTENMATNDITELPNKVNIDEKTDSTKTHMVIKPEQLEQLKPEVETNKESTNSACKRQVISILIYLPLILLKLKY